MRAALMTMAIVAVGFVPVGVAADAPRPTHPNAATQPNVVLILADDLGYGDLGCYGGTRAKTPHIDALAADGIRFTDFYAAQATCTSSRAALLTGCYPNRIGVLGALDHRATIGINPAETTLAEILHELGYRTAIVGKWHLGHRPEFSPLAHGFDEFFGLPYSHDMWPGNPANSRYFPPLPLIDGRSSVTIDPLEAKLTSLYTERATTFIERSASGPFFLYLAHSLPHVPLRTTREGRGDLYARVVEEIDDSLGKILATLKRTRVLQRTIVIFTSDNGPWLLYGDHGGSSGKLREGKATAFEGGVRVPCIVSWPGKIPGGRTSVEPAMNIDILPTVAALTAAVEKRSAAGKSPASASEAEPAAIDGQDLSALLLGRRDALPERSLYFYWINQLHAVRRGRWKLHLAHTYHHVAQAGVGGRQGRYETRRIGPALFDLARDPGEATDLAAQHPEVVEQLEQEAERARRDLGDDLTARKGAHVRPPGVAQP